MSAAQQRSIEQINLWPTDSVNSEAGEVLVEPEKHGPLNRHIRQISHPRLRVFVPEKQDPNRPACIVCPGGGYYLLAVDKEGDDVAKMLNRHGITAFVLVYRLGEQTEPPKAVLPPPVEDIRKAIQLVRGGADRWNIDPQRLGVMGFSAGGHLAGVAATGFGAEDATAQISARPDFGILIYPVISMHDPIANTGTRLNLLGEHPSQAAKDRYSIDQSITEKTPPLFLVHATDDASVDFRNSLNLEAAARSAGVPCELLTLHSGGHGFGLGVDGGEPTVWPAQCVDWMRRQKIVTSK